MFEAQLDKENMKEYYGQEVSTHENSEQKFELENKGVDIILRSRHMKTVNIDVSLVIKVSTHEFEESMHEDRDQSLEN